MRRYKDRNVTAEEAAEMVRLYVYEEKSLRDVADELDRDPQTVRNALKRHRIARRTYGEYVARKRERERQMVAQVFHEAHTKQTEARKEQ